MPEFIFSVILLHFITDIFLFLEYKNNLKDFVSKYTVLCQCFFLDCTKIRFLGILTLFNRVLAVRVRAIIQLAKIF